MKNRKQKVVFGSLLCAAALLLAGRTQPLQEKMYPQTAALRQSLRGVTEVRITQIVNPLQPFSTENTTVRKGREAQVLADVLEIVEAPFAKLLGSERVTFVCYVGGYQLRFYRGGKQAAQFRCSPDAGVISGGWSGVKTLTPDSKRRLNALLLR